MNRLLLHLLLIALAVLAYCGGADDLQAQERTVAIDTPDYTLPPADSIRIMDSLYRARKAMIDKWAIEHARTSRPQEDFLSVYAAMGAYVKIRANDLSEFFAERALRADPKSDRGNLSTVDGSFILAGQAQLSRSWGIFLEYDYSAKFFNTTIDTTLIATLHNAEESLDVTEHALVTGGMMMLYSSHVYRLRANGGLGAVFVKTKETESTTGATREASATGYQFNIDLVNDFRFIDRASFTIDFFSHSVATGELKTSDGETLNKPFGANPTAPSLSPRASGLIFGFAAGVVYYF